MGRSRPVEADPLDAETPEHGGCETSLTRDEASGDSAANPETGGQGTDRIARWIPVGDDACPGVPRTVANDTTERRLSHPPLSAVVVGVSPVTHLETDRTARLYPGTPSPTDGSRGKDTPRDPHRYRSLSTRWSSWSDRFKTRMQQLFMTLILEYRSAVDRHPRKRVDTVPPSTQRTRGGSCRLPPAAVHGTEPCPR